MAQLNNYRHQRRDFFLDSLYISTGPSSQHQPLREFTWTIISYQHHNRIRFTESQEFIPELVLSLLVGQVTGGVTKAGGGRRELSRCEMESDLNLLLNHSQSPTAFTSLIVSTRSEVWSHPLNISSREIFMFVLSNISTDLAR